MQKPPLIVHILHHPASEVTAGTAKALHEALSADPIVPGLRIPVRFLPEGAARVDLDAAERSFVVVLADEHLGAQDAWCTLVAETWERCTGDHHLLPIQLHEVAWPLDPRLEEVSFARAWAVEDPGERQRFVVRRVVHELCRHLMAEPGGDERAPVALFLSHAKQDLAAEPKAFAEIAAHLNNQQPIKTWIDSSEIESGSKFSEAIGRGVRHSALLAVVTDNWSSRAWCRREMLLAKDHQRPIVVVNALRERELRSFPYFGNVPVVEWASGRAADVVDLVLKETLRHLHVALVLGQQRQEGDDVFLRPPEQVTVVGRATRPILYPDPPLGEEELELLQRAGASVSTPLERLGRLHPELKGRVVALSVSESTDIGRYGLRQRHLDTGLMELSRYLLLRGATLSYGGHLGSDGYTVGLFNLVAAHNRLPNVPPHERIRNYLGWPLPLSEALKAKYRLLADIRRVDRPEGVDEALHPSLSAGPAAFFPAASPEERYAWARGMTAMRERQTAECDGRVVIGGSIGSTVTADPVKGRVEKWYNSRIPGVVEEALLTLRAGRPLFLCGAFGGGGRLLIDLLHGVEREEMTWAWQGQAPHALAMRALYEARGEPWWDYPEMVDFMRSRGIAGLNNGLDREENEELFSALDPLRMVALVLEGLGRVYGRA